MSSICSPSVRVVSLNGCLFPVGLRHGWRSCDKDNRLVLLQKLVTGQSTDEEQLKNVFSAIDIICLQEVFSSHWSSKWKASLLTTIKLHNQQNPEKQLHTAECPMPKMKRLHLMDGGLLIISKFPITSSTFHSFDCNPTLLRLADKGFLHAAINVNNQTLHLINTHLHPPEGSLTSKHSINSRKQQISQLKTYLEKSELYDKSSGVVVTGDLNIHQGSEESEQMKSSLEMAEESTIDNYAPTVHNQLRFCNHKEYLCGDFAIGRNVLFKNTKILKEHFHLSDHYPVQFDVEFCATDGSEAV
jgi:endonuclease/exonuclease/phosphatase family metal-dependent hydrolase